VCQTPEKLDIYPENAGVLMASIGLEPILLLGNGF
jgi:hypothetical protein